MANEEQSQSGLDNVQGSPNSSTPPSGTGDKMAALGFQDWQPHWQKLLQTNGTWWTRLGQEQPVYWLPSGIVEELGKAMPAGDERHRERPPVITKEEADAEHAFRQCCQTFSTSTVGVWGGAPVRYELLASPPIPSISDETMHALGWDRYIRPEAARTALTAVMDKADGARHQRLAYAGWLTFNADYRTEREALRARWFALKEKSPSWPLSASVGDQPATPVVAGSIDPALRLSADVATFVKDVTAFLRKWRLVSLATWDLPQPQGPLEGIPLGLAERLLGSDSIGTFYPPYFDTPSGQDLRTELRAQQRQSGKSAGIDPEFPLTDLSARPDHPSQWESAFRLWFIELAARSDTVSGAVFLPVSSPPSRSCSTARGTE